MAGLTDAERAALADVGDEANETIERESEPTELRDDPLPLLDTRASENAAEGLSLAFARHDRGSPAARRERHHWRRVCRRS
jgi:hypothetical protein